MIFTCKNEEEACPENEMSGVVLRQRLPRVAEVRGAGSWWSGWRCFEEFVIVSFFNSSGKPSTG